MYVFSCVCTNSTYSSNVFLLLTLFKVNVQIYSPCPRSLHDLLDVGTIFANDEQVVLRSYINLHANLDS